MRGKKIIDEGVVFYFELNYQSYNYKTMTDVYDRRCRE